MFDNWVVKLISAVVIYFHPKADKLMTSNNNDNTQPTHDDDDEDMFIVSQHE